MFPRYAYSLNPNPWEWLTSRKASFLVLPSKSLKITNITNSIVINKAPACSLTLICREAAEAMAEKVRTTFQAQKQWRWQ